MATLRTVTVKPSGGDYTSLNAALAGESADLVSLDRLLKIEPYAMLDTAAATTGTGYTEDATRYIWICPPASERHTGHWDVTKYRLIPAQWQTGLNVITAYTRIEGLQIQSANANPGRCYTLAPQVGPAASDIRLDGCLGIVPVNKGGVFHFAITSGRATLTNCIAHGPNTDNTGFYASYGLNRPTVTYYNCTAAGCGTGFTCTSGNVTVTNCYSGGNAVSDYTVTGSGAVTYITAASSGAAVITGVTANIAYSSTSGAYFNNVTPGSEDLRISNPLSALKDVGTDLSADTNWFARNADGLPTDVAGNIREGKWWIGAYFLPIEQRVVTVKPSDGTYQSLNAALAGESADLIALHRRVTVECYGMVDTTRATTGTGYTVDASRYLRIAAIDRHDGREAAVSGLNNYRIIIPNPTTSGFALLIQAKFTRVDGLEVSSWSTTTYTSQGGIQAAVGATDCIIEHCVVHDCGDPGNSGNASNGITINRGCTVRNNLIYNTSNHGIVEQQGYGSALYVYSNTVYDCARTSVSYYGIRVPNSNTGVVANNLVIAGPNSAGPCFLSVTPSGTLTASNNASSDATAPGTNSRTNQTFTFVDAAAKNFQLASTDAGAKGYGADLSAQFTADIAGNTRTTPWDIGAFKAAAGTPGGPTTGTGNITGYAEVAGVGSAMWVATAAAAASSTAAAVGARVAVAVATSAGVSTSTVVGAAVRPSVAASAGSATVAAVGAAPAVAVAASVSSSTAAAIGAAVAVGVGSSAGAATAAATSTSVVPTIVSAVGASASTSTAPAVGAALWSSIGQCLALAASAVVGVALAATVAASAGHATAPAVGRVTAVAVASSAGSAGVLGRSSAGLIQPATGAAIGSATVSATGAAVAVSRATSDGIAAAPGAGVAVAVTRGVAVGQGAATGTAVSTIAATGTAIATSTALGCAAAVAVAAGSSAGSSTAAGTALPPVAHMRVALTSCGPSADFTSTGPTVALASRGPSVEFGTPFAAEE